MLALLLLLQLLLSFSVCAAEDPGGKVIVPLHHWTEMLDTVQESSEPAAPPVQVLQVDRTIEGGFHKGVFSGQLSTRFIVPPGQEEHRVPVVASDITIGEAKLNGGQTSLLLEGAMFTVGVSKPGLHLVTTRFLQGREDDRFARRLSLGLPPSGPTRFSIWLPERDVEVRVSQGALMQVQDEGEGTRVIGNLDGKGRLDLSWKRRVEEANGAPLRAEARLNTVFTLREAFVQGASVFDYTLKEGETDRVEVVIPPDIEVVDVTGDSVLQWYTSGATGQDKEGRLSVLFRYIISDKARFQVHYQFPMDIEKGLSLRMPMPTAGTPLTGAVGVQGPAGIEVSTRRIEKASALSARDLPAELTELTRNPLLLGFSFTEAPILELDLKRHEEVELTNAIIDDIQASSVLIEDGTELTKLRLRLRNNTAQYLSLRLPPGSTLTHALLDGRPIRPAVGQGTDIASGQGEKRDSQEDDEVLLVPLQQSERLGPGQARRHEVREGETLGGISSLYYSNPTLWREILDANEGRLSGPEDLVTGQILNIPSRQGVEVQESSFIIEIAYKRSEKAWGLLGRRDVRLPDLDVDAVSITWHLYLPESVTPLDFHANLTQYSGLRYDPIRRSLQFLRSSLHLRRAWAGGKYENILSQRRSIYRAETLTRQGGQEVLSSFPLTGQKYRFERILLGHETPRVRMGYLRNELIPVIRWAAFAAAFALGLSFLGRRTWKERLPTLGGFAALLIVAHLVLGVHRRLLWAIDLVLLFDIARNTLGKHLPGLSQPPSLRTLLRSLGWRHLGWILALILVIQIACTLPLLLSLALLVVLLVARRVLR